MENLNSFFADAVWAVKQEGWGFSVDEVVQELWVWYLTNKSVRAKLEGWEESPKAKAYVKARARTVIGRLCWEERKFRADYEYSVDTVKAVLEQKLVSDKVLRDLEAGCRRLSRRHKRFTNILFRFYIAGERGMSAADKMTLSRARVALTDEINFALAKPEPDSDEPGRTLGDGVGRAKPKPTPISFPQQEPDVARGYFGRRTSSAQPPRKAHPPPASLADMQFSGEPYRPPKYTNQLPEEEKPDDR